MTRREQIEKLCEFYGKDFSKNHFGDWTPYSFEEMARVANNKQKPIITALLEENEKLRGALDRLSKRVDDYASAGCIEAYSYDETVKGNKDISLSDIVDLVNETLTSSPLDELLEGEK